MIIKAFSYWYRNCDSPKHNNRQLVRMDESTLREKFCLLVVKMLSATHHPALGLGLLHQIVLLRLADAGEDARLWVEVKHVALQTGQEVAEATNATDSHHTLRKGKWKEKNGI